MGLKVFTIDFQNLAKEKSFRYDVDFVDFQNRLSVDKYYSFKDLFQFSKNYKVNIDNLRDDFFYSEIGNVSKEGEVEPVKLNFNERKKIEENYYKKIEKGDIIQVKENNILLSKVRPNLKKYVFVDEDNKNYFYTSAFIHLIPIKLDKILYYSLRSIFYENLIAISRQGKSYPTLKEDDFIYLKFNKYIIDKFIEKEDYINDQIEPIEKKIKELKKEIKQPQEVINKVFTREFGFDIKKVNKVEQTKFFSITNDITYRNLYLRSSVRWHKIEPIQKVLYKNNPHIEKLGRYIVSTKNGWSPYCRESDSHCYVFGVNSISKDSYIKYDDLKKSNEYIKNISDYYVKENDLFISRGNTVDLVALASVVKNLLDDKNIIYPDLFIKIDVDEKRLDKEYLAHLFNSIIGRYYFKYATKGKNQTMVKVSSDELNNFYLPIPPKKTQYRIVDKIKIELDKQIEIKKIIKTERDKIDEIIEKVIN